MNGSGTLRAWNQSATPSRLHASLDLRRGSVSSPQTVAVIPDSGGNSASRDASFAAPGSAHRSPWWWLLSALIILPAAALVVQRVEPFKPDLLDVEWAVLTSRMGRARRWGRRLVGREPGNPDAIFLYGTALLHQGKFEDLIRRVEPLAEKVPTRLRSGIAYILAASAQKAGDKKRARRWGTEAVREPTLRSRMQGDGAWAEVLRHPARDDLIARAYA